MLPRQKHFVRRAYKAPDNGFGFVGDNRAAGKRERPAASAKCAIRSGNAGGCYRLRYVQAYWERDASSSLAFCRMVSCKSGIGFQPMNSLDHRLGVDATKSRQPLKYNA